MRLLVIILLFLTPFSVFSQCTVGSVLTRIDVDSVSVDTAGNVRICWQASPDPNIVRYFIIGINPLTGSFTRIDSVDFPNVCYTIPSSMNNSDSTSIELGIGVKDSCGNELVTVLDLHNTIFLEDSTNICSGTIFLNWNPYDDFDTGLNVRYTIYVSENGNPFTEAGNTSETTYNFTGANQGSTYTFYVTGVENDGAGPFSSSSNSISINTTSFLVPASVYLYTATVIDSQQIDIQFYVDTAADVQSYIISRSLNPNNNYETVGSILASTGMNPFQLFSDFNVTSNTSSYYYRVEAINICGDTTFVSNLGRSILLEVNSDGFTGSNILSWNIYEDWLGNVEEYEIYRSIGGIQGLSLINTIDAQSGVTAYIDEVSNILEGNGEFCYQIRAKESPITHMGNLPDTALSLSNEVCVDFTPILYVPNAFNPFGRFNRIFKPVISYAEPSSYTFSIYNRWGEKIFETEDIKEGWNGKYKNTGELSELGMYVYVILYQSSEGEDFKRRGVVNLIR